MDVVASDLLRQDQTLAEMVRRLAEAFQPERLYLFGSKARGESGPDRWTREAFDSRFHLKASLPSTIVREGRTVYAT